MILLHSFNGLETVRALVEDGLKTPAAREDVNMNAAGLTGFCAGGRSTMLLLPQIRGFQVGRGMVGLPRRGRIGHPAQATRRLYR